MLIRVFACAGLLAGCGITRPDTCQSSTDCQQAFGWGHTCSSDGVCEELEQAAPCATGWPEDLWQDRAAHADDLIIGSVIGDGFGLERDAMRLAVDQVNDLGGIDGHPVGVLECTPAGQDAEREASLTDIAMTLEGAGVQVVVGPVLSSDARLMADVGLELAYISPGASAISLASGAGSPVWRTVPSDTDLAQAIVRDMLDEGLAKAVVVHSRELGQTELAEEVVVGLAYAGLTGEALAFESATERDARVVEAAYANADAVVVLSEDSTDYIDALVGASVIDEYEDLTVYVGPGAYTEDLLNASAAAPLFPNLRGVRSAIRGGVVADVFRSSYMSSFNADPNDSGYSGQAYDSAWAAFSAMLWSGMRNGTIDHAGVVGGMGNLSFGEPLSLGPTGWSDLQAAFADATPVDLDGASSPLDFDAGTRAIRGPVAVWVIEGGEFTTSREYAF